MPVTEVLSGPYADSSAMLHRELSPATTSLRAARRFGRNPPSDAELAAHIELTERLKQGGIEVLPETALAAP